MSVARVSRYLAKQRDSGQLSSIALIVTIGLFWGGNWPAVRFILADVPPFTLRAIGFTTGAVLLLSWACWRRLPLKVSRQELPWLAVTGFFTILGFNLATAFGQLHMPTSQAAIIAFSMPCWALLLGWLLLGQRITKRQWLGLACGQAGLLVLLGPSAWASGVTRAVGVTGRQSRIDWPCHHAGGRTFLGAGYGVDQATWRLGKPCGGRHRMAVCLVRDSHDHHDDRP